MRKITLTIAMAILVAITTFAQTPQAFKYQAVVRDNAGEILENQAVSLRMGIRDGSAGGTVIYRETHSATTNQFGLVNIKIGDGTPNIGTFLSIGWGSGDKYLQTELDPTGGTSYVSMGTAQLMSVPYALYAENTENVDDADADPANELQALSINGNDLTISDGNTITLPGTGGGDNLGNHTATENMKLSNNWLSNDGGSEGVYVADNGYVGINTNTPGSELMVEGHIVSSGMIFASPGSINEATYRFGQGEENTGFSSPDYQSIAALTYGIERMRITHNGDVGIGTSTPSSELEVNGTIEATAFVGNGSGLTGITGDNLGNHT
ncbi:MAG: hypothetical protein DRJ05_20625, partial [Bacteroidetes bacterium]